MPWWAWWGLGLLLILLELLTPLGFYLIFFGVGALLVGGLAGLLLTVPPWAEWLLFAACSILAMLVFRRPVLTRFHAGSQRSASDSMVGETALALEDIAGEKIEREMLRLVRVHAKGNGGGVDASAAASDRHTRSHSLPSQGFA